MKRRTTFIILVLVIAALAAVAFRPLHEAYDRRLRQRTDATVRLAAAAVGANHLDEAEALLRDVDATHADARKLAALRSAIAQRRADSFPLVFDRNGGVIANYRPATNDLFAVDSRYSTLIEREAGTLTIESNLHRLGTADTIATTLDPEVQNAAIRALGAYRGAIVAIDPRTNEILAIVSKETNVALEKQFEPGSIIKVLTGLNALSNGVNVTFPYNCTGDLMIDGRHFGDWLGSGHGTLPTFDDALAQSCNIVFADIGLRLGEEKLRTFMTRAGFDGQTNVGLVQVPLGKIIPPIFNRFETAFLAIGLEHESVNTLHVAMLASMMANRGVLTQPRLLRERRSVLGEVVSSSKPLASTRLAPAEAAEQMVHAMTTVVTNEHGTGRRAAVEGVPIAMKTGTAGNRKDGGLEALILGFAPADHPKIAFGIIAEDAGPAEFAGAKIAHDFVAALRSRL